MQGPILYDIRSTDLQLYFFHSTIFPFAVRLKKAEESQDNNDIRLIHVQCGRKIEWKSE